MSLFCGLIKRLCHRRSLLWKPDTPIVRPNYLRNVRVAPEIFERVLPRLYTFMDPFVATFQGQAAEQHAKTYVCGLVSDIERKNVESIAYRFGQSRLPLQGFIGWAQRDDDALPKRIA